MTFTESVVEEAALEWLQELGYDVAHGPDIAPGEFPERSDYDDVVLLGRLQSCRPAQPRSLTRSARRGLPPGHPSQRARSAPANRAFHKLLTNGVPVEEMRNGEPRGEQVRLIDFDDPGNNDWLAVNQFTVIEGASSAGPISWSSSTACRWPSSS